MVTALRPDEAAPAAPAAPAAGARRPRATVRAAAQACHSVIARADRSVQLGEIHRNLLRAAQWLPDLPAVEPWTAPVPASCDPARATRDAEREALRPLHPDGPPLRVVLIPHPDHVDLVLVASRALLSGAELSRLATGLLGGADQPASIPSSVSALGPSIRPAPTSPAGHTGIEWGLGEPSRAGRSGEVAIRLPATLRPDDAALLGAVALVAARYGGASSAAVTLLDTDGVAGAVHGYDVPMDAVCAAGAYLKQFSASGSTGARDPVPPVAVVRTAGDADVRYRPFLAPVLPVVVHWRHGPDGRVLGVLSYDEGEVHPGVAEAFAEYVGHVVEQFVATPDLPVGEVALMTADQVREILLAGSPPGLPDGAGGTIPDLFADVVRRRPDALAVTDATGSLTYRELDERAARMVAGLRACGVGQGALVGVALERTTELVVSLLAVLKAGAGYVPMDLAYPADRLRYTVQNAGAQVVIAARGFPDMAGVTVISPAALSALAERDGAPALPEQAGPHDDAAAAYVIYTSGSTGRPKGVVVPHRNVAALVATTAADFGLGRDDVWTFFHSAAFDFSVWEIWGCLLTGGRLVVVDYWVSRDFEQFHELLVDERVTVLSQTPSAFEQLIDADARGTADLAVRLVIFGGEPLDVRVLSGWFARHPASHCRLVNMFGITETTVHVTWQTVTPVEMVAGSRSVGRALPGWQVSVRDPQGRVLPIGAAGEIVVGGVGVADRYLGQPELTAQRFVVDPYLGGRVYRSGDLGRLRPDGRLDHLGRIDSQVKLRGHRIELDEIRTVFLAHPAVTGAAVVLACATPGDAATARLEVYVTLRDTTATRALIDHARRALPPYMIPSLVAQVPVIPLTVNGKLDRAALAAAATTAPVTDPVTDPAADPAVEPAGDGAGAVPGGDPFAAEILALWSSALNVEVRPDDNFFELGGNSLLVVRLLRSLRERGLGKVSAQDFYRHSTAAAFVELVRP
jgi:amino acid adenylation domain-containing protein